MKLLEVQHTFVGADVVKCFLAPWGFTYILYDDSGSFFIRDCEYNRIYFLGEFSSEKIAVHEFISFLIVVCPDGFSELLKERIKKKLN